MNTHKIILGDCIEGMNTLPDGCVHTCITSPPYFGLRDYGTGTWEGGDPDCDHIDETAMAERMRQKKSMIVVGERMDGSTRTRVHDEEIGKGIQHQHLCKKCGAKRTDSQIGQEDTVEGYVQKMVEVFREVRRILRDDGTLWLNLGDSYMSAKNCSPPPQTQGGQRGMPSDFVPPNRKDQKGLKTKDLIGIPWRVAFALQADGWYLRQDIIWHKPNPMPESVTDRCTKAHEYIFMLSKKPHYFYDYEAIKEPLAESSIGRKERKKNLIDRTGVGTLGKQIKEGVNSDHGYSGLALGRNGKTGYSEDGKRNKRSVWTVTTKPFRGAHFAVYPEDLILPCVLAGTSEHGCCPQCGKPWERVVERTKTFESGSGRSGNPISGKQDLSASETNSTPDIRMGPCVQSHTTGWSPACECGGEPVPCTVLDPFTGSGTTAVVALKNGRNYIGTELNPEYVKIAEARIKKFVPQTLEEIFE